jgi:hypothetical protein
MISHYRERIIMACAVLGIMAVTIPFVQTHPEI